MCSGPQWKREYVPDHKFDFIDTRDFTDNGCWMRMRYLWIYVLVLKSFLVYVFDIFTAITMLTTSDWSNHIFDSCTGQSDNGCVFIPFSIGRWLFFGCIIFSFLLLAYETRKARKIIQSRDISYAFTNIMANNYYSLRSYDHFCFFCQINNSTKKKDDFAFFVFFTFKSWKRLLLADGPRQVINGLTLYSFYLSQENKGPFWDFSKYTNGSIMTGGLIISTLTTVLIFIGSALLLLAAGICYIPLLCYIQGNLKEYCCHKVDKRIAEIVKRKKKERLAQAAALAKKEAAGDYSHLKNKKGEIVGAVLPQPTLPNITLDDDEFSDSTSARTRVNPSTYTTSNDYYYNSDYKNTYANPADYPAMPPYNQQQYDYKSQEGYASSVQTGGDERSLYYADQYNSRTNLTGSTAPVTRTDSVNRTGTPANAQAATHDGYGYAISGDAQGGYANNAEHQAYQQSGAYAYTGQNYDDGRGGYAYDNYSGAHAVSSNQQNAYYDQQGRNHYDTSAYHHYDNQGHYQQGQGSGYADYGHGGVGYAVG